VNWEVFRLSNAWVTKVKSIFLESSKKQKKYILRGESNFGVSIITQFYPPDYAATGQLIQELAIQLSEQGMHVNVFTGQPGYAFKKHQAPSIEQVNRLKIRRSRASQLWSNRIRGKAINGVLFCLRAGLHLLKHRKETDVLLLTTAPPFLSIIGYLTHLCFGIPYVCLVYDLYPDAAIELDIISANHFIARLWNKVNSLVWQNAQGIIVLSSTMKERIVNKHPQIAEQISVIHNWADANWIKPLPKQENWFAQNYGTNKKFTVLYSGNLGRCHDIETILGAMELLKDKPIQFVFIGAGAKQENFIEEVDKLGLRNCLFLPYQDRENLPYSLTACDLAFVSIAPGMEGVVAPSKLYGLMAAGTAIAAICEPHSYLRRVITSAQCGASFNHNDSKELAEFIHFLSLNPSWTAAMGASGRRYLEANFTPEIIARQYTEVLNPDQYIAEGYGEVNSTESVSRSQKPEVRNMIFDAQ
jgi:glycosyltransferase involved in cell wall biosynthesis